MWLAALASYSDPSSIFCGSVFSVGPTKKLALGTRLLSHQLSTTSDSEVSKQILGVAGIMGSAGHEAQEFHDMFLFAIGS